MTDTLQRVRRTALASLRPPPRLRLSEWIESEMRLPEGVSALPGRVTLWVYQREIADAITDPAIERVTLVKPVRVGFTTLLTGGAAQSVRATRKALQGIALRKHLDGGRRSRLPRQGSGASAPGAYVGTMDWAAARRPLAPHLGSV